MDAVDYGEYTPRIMIDGGSRPWPLSWASQNAEARRYLRLHAAKAGVDLVRGMQVLVHWNRLPPTILRFREVAGFDFFEELDPTTGEVLPERTWAQLAAHVQELHTANGIKPFDRPPGADRPD